MSVPFATFIGLLVFDCAGCCALSLLGMPWEGSQEMCTIKDAGATCIYVVLFEVFLYAVYSPVFMIFKAF